MVKLIKKDWWVLLLILVSLIFGMIVYPSLPEQIPSHWNIKGEVDSYVSKAFGVYFFPLLTLAIYLLMISIPYIDPRRDNYFKHRTAYNILRYFLVVFLLALYNTTLINALGYAIDVPIIVRTLTAIMFIIIGNYMGQIKHNYTFGIRLPWTLANETVWRKTHRLGSYLFFISGVIMLLTLPLSNFLGFIITISLPIITILTTAVYSYLIFKKRG